MTIFLQQDSEFVFVGFTVSLLIDKCSFVWSGQCSPCCHLPITAMMQIMLIQTESNRSAARVQGGKGGLMISSQGRHGLPLRGNQRRCKSPPAVMEFHSQSCSKQVPSVKQCKYHYLEVLTPSEGCLVNWTSKKQPIMGMSSCEAELIACAERAQAGRFSQQPMEESIGYEPVAVIFEDNAGCVSS
jgi:hypothetical protein